MNSCECEENIWGAEKVWMCYTDFVFSFTSVVADRLLITLSFTMVTHYLSCSINVEELSVAKSLYFPQLF